METITRIFKEIFTDEATKGLLMLSVLSVIAMIYGGYRAIKKNQ